MYSVYIAAIILLSLYSLARTWRGTIEFLPSIGWLFILAIPFAIEYPLFNPAIRDLQAVSILFIAFMLLAGDLMAARFVKTDSVVHDDPGPALKLAYGMAAAYVIITAWHLFSADRIPILEILSGPAQTEAAQAHTRNVFTRDVIAFAPIRYLCSFSTHIIAFPAVLIFFSRKRIVPALLLLAWATFYAIAGTAKSPLAMGLLTLLVGSIVITPMPCTRKLIRGLMVAGIASLFVLSALNLFSPYEGILKHLPEKYAAPNTPSATTLVDNLGDYTRTRIYDTGQQRPFVWRKLDYVLYRVFFTPAEVAERWYEYFYYYPVDSVIINRQINDGRSHTRTHPANAVGLWAFYERHPNNYTKEAYAYAAIDADAHARFGVIGVIVAGLMLLGLRLWLAVFNDRRDVTHGVFYAGSIGLLCYLPASASIQAILIPQGLAVLALVLFLLYVSRSRRA